jgi:hypothetical protein
MAIELSAHALDGVQGPVAIRRRSESDRAPCLPQAGPSTGSTTSTKASPRVTC